MPQFILLVALNAIFFYSKGWLRLPAALAFTFVLPGWAWLPGLGWLHTRQAIERLMLAVGLSSLFSALALLAVLLMPGPLTEAPVLVALNLISGLGIAVHLVRRPAAEPVEWPPRRILLILLAILAVAAGTRLIRLGYAEFHEDDLENMRLIVRAYKGEEYAPFLDSKGPIHWLLPAALWYLHGWLTEGLARAPFAIASLLLIPTMYALGRRMSGGRDEIGLLAAGFVTLNGFYVAYARHVENQSLIVLWGALAMWFAYRYYREDAPHFLPWVALALGVGLVAHPDTLLYLPVFGYIIWQGKNHRHPWLWAALLIFVAVTASFYAPYLTDPNIDRVQQYFAQDRIGTALFYNRIHNLFDQDGLYSTRYHAPLLVLLLSWLLFRQFGRWGWGGLALLSGLGLAIISTVAWPGLWLIGGLNLAFVPYALLTVVVLLLPSPRCHASREASFAEESPSTRPSRFLRGMRLGMTWERLFSETPTGLFEFKTLFLWFSAPLGALLFLAKDAADHIQIAYTAWALLTAFALADLWRRLKAAWLRGLLIVILAVIAGLILSYQYLAFVAPVSTYWQAKIAYENNPRSIYGRLYGSVPRPRKIFGNPRLSGWKVVGYLWETGVLSGDFRSINESFAVPIWYTFQTPRSCYTTPQHYWVRRSWNGWPEEEADLPDMGYTLTRIVTVDGQPTLHLYERNVPPRQPEILPLADYRHRFDRLTTPARFGRDEIQGEKRSLNFGDKLLLIGHDLPPAAAQPGDLLPITVYWESLAPMDTRYRAFMHLVGPDGRQWGQHDDDPACRLLTTDMRPGQRSSRQFRLPVALDTPPGVYEVVFGLYHPQTLERLPIWDNWAKESAGESLILGRVKIDSTDH